MKSSKVLIKRSNSPLEAPKTIQVSDRKKSNINLASNHYKKGIKQFDTYGKTQKKRNNYLKQLLRTNGDSTNKYRIVTEPVEEKLLYLGNNNFANPGKAFKMNSNSRNRLQSNNFHDQYSQKYLKLNIRTSHNSKQKLKTGESFHAKNELCKNCEKYKEQLNYLKKQLSKICMDKILWKSGQMHLEDVKESFFCLQKDKKGDKWLSPQLSPQKLLLKSIDKQMADIRNHFYDMMRDIDSLSAIDYPKMLSLNVFKYDPFYTQSSSAQEQQLKQLLCQLRYTLEGKVNGEELNDVWDYSTEDYSKKIFRNLKNRLQHYLRQNLQLKLRKEILERSEQITQQSQDYLRKIIEDVLLSYRDDQKKYGYE